MFILVPARPGCPGQNPERSKTVVVVVVVVVCLCYWLCEVDMKRSASLLSGFQWQMWAWMIGIDVLSFIGGKEGIEIGRRNGEGKRRGKGGEKGKRNGMEWERKERGGKGKRKGEKVNNGMGKVGRKGDYPQSYIKLGAYVCGCVDVVCGWMSRHCEANLGGTVESLR